MVSHICVHLFQTFQANWCLVLNLRILIIFKILDMQHVAALMFEKHDYMFKLDFKSGYHYVDIFIEQ